MRAAADVDEKFEAAIFYMRALSIIVVALFPLLSLFVCTPIDWRLFRLLAQALDLCGDATKPPLLIVALRRRLLLLLRFARLQVSGFFVLFFCIVSLVGRARARLRIASARARAYARHSRSGGGD